VAGVSSTLRVVFAVFVAAFACRAAPAQAQFGYASPPPRLYGYQAARPYREPFPWWGARSIRPDSYERDSDGGDPAPATTYRTLCVRLCDGFYFPISFATGGGGLSRDADRCSASCGAEARLFYYESPGGDVSSMVDLTGLAYSALPNAFRYRKTLVEGCQCRPQPWSEAEVQRHREYAGAASAAGVQKIAPSERDGVAHSDAIARPAAVDRDALEHGGSHPGPRYVWPGNRRPRY
jgi:hypothetical protein